MDGGGGLPPRVVLRGEPGPLAPVPPGSPSRPAGAWRRSNRATLSSLHFFAASQCEGPAAAISDLEIRRDVADGYILR